MRSKPHLILVHGMWSRPWVWDRWRIRLERAGFPCTVVTLPGHEDGAPDGAVAGLGIADYVEAVARDIAHVDRPVLIGHSLGGLVSQLIATRMPLTALVLVCSAAPGQVFPLRPVMLPGLARHFADPFLWRRAFRLSRFEADHLLLNAVPKGDRAAIRDRLSAESGRLAYEVGFGRFNLARSNRVRVDRITCPIRAVAAVRDRIIPIGVSRALAAAYRGTIDYSEYERHAHWILDEPGSDEPCDAIIDWINALNDHRQSRAVPL